MTQTVADILVGALESIGVKQIFALIGDPVDPLAVDSSRPTPEQSDGQHETRDR